MGTSRYTAVCAFRWHQKEQSNYFSITSIQITFRNPQPKIWLKTIYFKKHFLHIVDKLFIRNWTTEWKRLVNINFYQGTYGFRLKLNCFIGPLCLKMFLSIILQIEFTEIICVVKLQSFLFVFSLYLFLQHQTNLSFFAQASLNL